MRNYRLYIMLVFLALGITSCGVKPSSVEAPQGRDKDMFPHTYPSEVEIKK